MKNYRPNDVGLCLCSSLLLMGVICLFCSLILEQLRDLSLVLFIMAFIACLMGERISAYTKEKERRRKKNSRVFPIQKINPVTIRVEQVTSTY
tara:strand:+ start:3675 stop:3953 length:279 start_codon:yes stop_codon:yes gene_type:complete